MIVDLYGVGGWCSVMSVQQTHVLRSTKMTFETCDYCAVALVNGDLSGLEFFYGDEKMASIEASIEAMGLVALTETLDLGSYFECFVCDEVCIGEMSTFERI